MLIRDCPVAILRCDIAKMSDVLLPGNKFGEIVGKLADAPRLRPGIQQNLPEFEIGNGLSQLKTKLRIAEFRFLYLC